MMSHRLWNAEYLEYDCGEEGGTRALFVSVFDLEKIRSDFEITASN